MITQVRLRHYLYAANPFVTGYYKFDVYSWDQHIIEFDPTVNAECDNRAEYLLPVWIDAAMNVFQSKRGRASSSRRSFRLEHWQHFLLCAEANRNKLIGRRIRAESIHVNHHEVMMFWKKSICC